MPQILSRARGSRHKPYPTLNLLCGILTVVTGIAVSAPVFAMNTPAVGEAQPLEAYAVELLLAAAIVVVGVGLLRLRVWAWWIAVSGLSVSVLSHVLFLLQMGLGDPSALQLPFEVPLSPWLCVRVVVQPVGPFFVGLLMVYPLPSLLIQAMVLAYHVGFRGLFIPQAGGSAEGVRGAGQEPARAALVALAAIGAVSAAAWGVGSARAAATNRERAAAIKQFFDAYDRRDIGAMAAACDSHYAPFFQALQQTPSQTLNLLFTPSGYRLEDVRVLETTYLDNGAVRVRYSHNRSSRDGGASATLVQQEGQWRVNTLGGALDLDHWLMHDSRDEYPPDVSGRPFILRL